MAKLRVKSIISCVKADSLIQKQPTLKAFLTNENATTWEIDKENEEKAIKEIDRYFKINNIKYLIEY